MSGLRISQLAERSGVPATTLRFYETVGLLPAERTPSGYRVYDETAVERLDFIGAARSPRARRRRCRGTVLGRARRSRSSAP